MKLNDWLSQAVHILETASVPTARLDGLVLLEDATGKDRGWLLAHPEFELSDKIATKLQKQIEKRASHTPLAYIRGKSEFYGREFIVTPDTLQPRAETETMVDLLKQIQDREQRAESRVIVDVGTGSGCLAITAKLEFPEAEVYATEINEATLKIARKNAQKLKADVTFLQGDLLDPFLRTRSLELRTLLLANLPYVPNAHTINKAAMQEPKIAIFGGEDGLELYRMLFEQVEQFSVLSSQFSGSPEYILTESLPFQHQALARIAEKHGYRQIAEEDFIQVFTKP